MLSKESLPEYLARESNRGHTPCGRHAGVLTISHRATPHSNLKFSSKRAVQQPFQRSWRQKAFLLGHTIPGTLSAFFPAFLLLMIKTGLSLGRFYLSFSINWRRIPCMHIGGGGGEEGGAIESFLAYLRIPERGSCCAFWAAFFSSAEEGEDMLVRGTGPHQSPATPPPPPAHIASFMVMRVNPA
jgi:hypothetical protein